MKKWINTFLIFWSLAVSGYGNSEGNLMAEEDKKSRILFEFTDADEAENWFSVNDDVMGGVSRSKVANTEDSCLLFSGSLSLENNGGFTSIRCKPTDFGLGGYSGIRIRVKGDGRTYQFRIRTNRNFDGFAFKHEFATEEDSWVERDLPFSAFIPTFRGRTLIDVGPLDPKDIRQMGFLLADKQAGPFNLQIDRITAY